MKTRSFPSLLLFAIAIAADGAQTPTVVVNALLQAEAGAQIVERGQDFAVFRQVTATTNAAGTATFVTHRAVEQWHNADRAHSILEWQGLVRWKHKRPWHSVE